MTNDHKKSMTNFPCISENCWNVFSQNLSKFPANLQQQKNIPYRYTIPVSTVMQYNSSENLYSNPHSHHSPECHPWPAGCCHGGAGTEWPPGQLGPRASRALSAGHTPSPCPGAAGCTCWSAAQASAGRRKRPSCLPGAAVFAGGKNRTICAWFLMRKKLVHSQYTALKDTQKQEGSSGVRLELYFRCICIWIKRWADLHVQ